MRVAVTILAAGSARRFGQDKTQVLIGGRPVWRWSLDTFRRHPLVEFIVLVGSPDNETALRASEADVVVLGGDSRQASATRAVQAIPPEFDAVLIHDGARPFVSPSIIDRVIDGLTTHPAVAAAIPVTDTIKQASDGKLKTLDRSTLWSMQTPQGAHRGRLAKALDSATIEYTDEMALLESTGITPQLVAGEPTNFKLTTPDDLARAQAFAGFPEYRTGMGYDVHSFSSDRTRTMMLGGVAFPGEQALDGHSDADALLHAATDALLGAAALGDIGQHFPNTDPRWQGAPSLTFLAHAARLLVEAGWQIVNLDMTVVAERPKVMKRAEEIRSVVGNCLGIDASRVSIKATTNERMGFVGREEGIAALAVATISR